MSGENNKAVTVTIGGGLTVPLLILFIALKLTGEIDWSWVWVLAPLWWPIGLIAAVLAAFAVVAAFLFIAAGIGAGVDALVRWVRR